MGKQERRTYMYITCMDILIKSSVFYSSAIFRCRPPSCYYYCKSYDKKLIRLNV